MPKDPTENPIPQHWRDLGYTGSFQLMLGLSDQETGGPPAEAQIAGLKAIVPYEPYGPEGGWLALAVEEVGGEPQVIMVRRDTAAIVDFVTGPRIGG